MKKVCKKQNKRIKKRGRLKGVIRNVLLEKEGKSEYKKRRAHPTFIASNFLGALQAIHILRYAKIDDFNLSPRPNSSCFDAPSRYITSYFEVSEYLVWFFLNGFQNWPWAIIMVILAQKFSRLRRCKNIFGLSIKVILRHIRRTPIYLRPTVIFCQI